MNGISPVAEFVGRSKIYTAYEPITAENVKAALNDALPFHMENARQMDYLYWYRRGAMPVLNKTKEVRPEINHKVRVNHAARLVSFKNGYFMSKPASYITRRNDDEINKKVAELNEYLYNSGKHHVDTLLVDSFHTMGLGNCYITPNEAEEENRPVVCHYLDPRSSFVVYSLRPGNEPVFGVSMVRIGKDLFFDVFTNTNLYRLRGPATAQDTTVDPNDVGLAVELLSEEANLVGDVPIIEYQYNSSRMACFETGIDLIDSINAIESLREDSVDQAVQQLCVAVNCQFDENETANSIREKGMVCLAGQNGEKPDFKILDSYVDQSQTQVTIENLTNRLDDICGIPSAARSTGSTSDNVGAVYLRSGWSLADTDCRNTEEFFMESNARFDRIFIKVLKERKGFTLNTADFQLCFPRNDVSNMLIKTQVAINLKSLGFSPELALERSGLSTDPVTDVEQSRTYMDAIWNPVVPDTNTVGGDAPVEQPGAGNPGGNPDQAEGGDNNKGDHWVSGYFR